MKQIQLSTADLVRAFFDSLIPTSGQRYCFVLGSGASATSGIPTAKELVEQWLKEMSPNRTESLGQWAANNLDIEGFTYDRRAEFYCQVYEERFSLSPKNGHAHLEMLMAMPNRAMDTAFSRRYW